MNTKKKKKHLISTQIKPFSHRNNFNKGNLNIIVPNYTAWYSHIASIVTYKKELLKFGMVSRSTRIEKMKLS